MIYATKIKMKPACGSSGDLQEISQIYLQGDNIINGYYYKSDIHDYLQKNPKSICVKASPYYPYLQPAISSNGEKYVKSESNSTGRDNLLCLPRS